MIMHNEITTSKLKPDYYTWHQRFIIPGGAPTGYCCPDANKQGLKWG